MRRHQASWRHVLVRVVRTFNSIYLDDYWFERMLVSVFVSALCFLGLFTLTDSSLVFISTEVFVFASFLLGLLLFLLYPLLHWVIISSARSWEEIVAQVDADEQYKPKRKRDQISDVYRILDEEAPDTLADLLSEADPDPRAKKQ